MKASHWNGGRGHRPRRNRCRIPVTGPVLYEGIDVNGVDLARVHKEERLEGVKILGVEITVWKTAHFATGV